MKTILNQKKYQVIIITILVVCFAISANTVQALSFTPHTLEEPIIIKEIKPIKTPGFIPIGKAPHVEFPTIKPIIIIPIDLSIDKLFNEKFSINNTTNSLKDCVTPTAGMEITENTTFCVGEHIYTPGETYQFIKITANNVTLDCDDAILSTTGNEVGGWPAIVVEGDSGADLNNVTIKNCVINEFVFPIQINNTDYATLSNITYNYGSIVIFNSDNGDFSYLNKPIDSDGSNDIASLHLTNSHYNNIYDNNIYHSFGINLSYSSSFNMVHDNSLGYLPYAEEYGDEDYPASFYLGAGANNNEFYDNEIIENSSTGLYGTIIYGDTNTTYGNTINNKIYNNTISNNYISINLTDITSNNEIYENSINGAIYNGLLIWSNGTNYPDNNTITNNIFSNSDHDIVIGPGINNHEISNNTFTDTTDRAIWLWSDGTPTNVPAENNQILNNKIIGTGPIGIELATYSSINSNIEGNHIKNRTNAGVIIGSDNDSTTFTLNNFVNNVTQVTDESSSTYNDGINGNFWSDFDELNEGCNDINQDGKCDLPYTAIDGTGGNIDNYPLTGAPTLEPIENISINELNNAIINIIAADPQGDELTYSVDNTNFLSMEGCWPDSHAFRWVTNKYSAGSYIVNATVTDGIHEISQSVSINVANTCQINKWGEMICSSYYIPVNCY
ncbi:MAG: NosD domain-containing protein [Candidatus Kerfeldbacteria bacterium]